MELRQSHEILLIYMPKMKINQIRDYVYNDQCQ